MIFRNFILQRSSNRFSRKCQDILNIRDFELLKTPRLLRCFAPKNPRLVPGMPQYSDEVDADSDIDMDAGTAINSIGGSSISTDAANHPEAEDITQIASTQGNQFFELSP